MIVRFFDGAGADISEDAQRKIERLFQREDYRRVFPTEIGDIQFPPRALEDYAAALEATVEMSAIASRRFKLVVDYAYCSTSGLTSSPSTRTPPPPAPSPSTPSRLRRGWPSW